MLEATQNITPPPEAQEQVLAKWNFAQPDHYAFVDGDDNETLHLMVDGMKCAGCMRNIERTLSAFDGLDQGRINFSTSRLVMRWKKGKFNPADAINAVMDKGFHLAPYDPDAISKANSQEDRKLLIALAVAGFAMINVMMLSFAVWAGEASGMSAETRGLLHWLSALVALPTVIFSGRPFFSSALGALKGKHLNMDVPISLAVILAAGMSLYETNVGGAHTYFDAAVSLLFFLLIGRFLDRRARSKARDVGQQLLGLQATAATIIHGNGKTETLPLHVLDVGQVVLVAVGEKIPVDGCIISGSSELDTSLVTGETLPRNVAVGDKVFAGTLNTVSPLQIEITALGEDTLLGEIAKLMETAEQGKNKYVRLADRVATIYAPVVHLMGLFTFLGWFFLMGVPWQVALMNAIAVLIITCPCALALAVPAVQVIASGRLMRGGVLLKSGDALERVATIDTVVFDKTGTLTTGRLVPVAGQGISPEHIELASAIAANSKHPVARAVHNMAPDVATFDGVTETPGMGLEAEVKGKKIRLGNRDWCGVKTKDKTKNLGPELWLKLESGDAVCFQFEDAIRDDARQVVDALKEKGLAVVLLSGDRAGVVEDVANKLGISHYHSAMTPVDKAQFIEMARGDNEQVFMVGDGLNDAPALAAANVSISPTTASDLSQVTADMVFQGQHLSPILEVIEVSKRSNALVKQNFGLAFFYNIFAIPLAVMGLATPLVAAIAMSSSSILVILNALRLKRP
jgi:Cu2+-exporting ATPase